MKEILITNSNIKALVDDEDYARAAKYNWSIGGTTTEYARCTINGKTIYLHHFVLKILDPSKETPIEHKDDNPFNCQKFNLIRTTCSHNQQGCSKPRTAQVTSKYIGVYWHKRRNKWWSKIAQYGVHWHIGYFKTEEEAAKAYNLEAIRRYGTDARINQL